MAIIQTDLVQHSASGAQDVSVMIGMNADGTGMDGAMLAVDGVITTDMIQQPATGGARPVGVAVVVNADGSPVTSGGGGAAPGADQNFVNDEELAKLQNTEIYTTAEKAKLGGIETGATKNATDSNLRDRSTHTGTQTADTISDLPGMLNKVKASETDVSPSFLDGKTDGTTIVIESNKLVVKDIDGLTIGITDLNSILSGTDGNIQNQLNDLTDTIINISGGMTWLGKIETFAELSNITTMQNGSVVLVLADESRGGGRNLYVYSESLGLWDFIGGFTFSDSFIALQDTPGNYTGHDGKVVRVDEANEKVIFDNVRWAEIQNKPSSMVLDIDLSVNQRHEHTNKTTLDKFGENEEGEPTFDGVEIGGGDTAVGGGRILLYEQDFIQEDSIQYAEIAFDPTLFSSIEIETFDIRPSNTAYLYMEFMMEGVWQAGGYKSSVYGSIGSNSYSVQTNQNRVIASITMPLQDGAWTANYRVPTDARAVGKGYGYRSDESTLGRPKDIMFRAPQGVGAVEGIRLFWRDATLSRTFRAGRIEMYGVN